VGRVIRLALALAALAGGILLALYGLLAFVYRGDANASTYVTLAGRRLDTHVVGGIAVALAIAAILLAAGLARGKYGRS
jgi:hypothetical protein